MCAHLNIDKQKRGEILLLLIHSFVPLPRTKYELSLKKFIRDSTQFSFRCKLPQPHCENQMSHLGRQLLSFTLKTTRPLTISVSPLLSFSHLHRQSPQVHPQKYSSLEFLSLSVTFFLTKYPSPTRSLQNRRATNPQSRVRVRRGRHISRRESEQKLSWAKSPRMCLATHPEVTAPPQIHSRFGAQ